MHRVLRQAENVHTAVAEDVGPKPEVWLVYLELVLAEADPVPMSNPRMAHTISNHFVHEEHEQSYELQGSSSVAFSCTTQCQSSYMRYKECVESREDLPDLALDSIQRDGPSGSEA